MEHLLNSGNLAGICGLLLMVGVGFRLVRHGHRGGWFLSMGASLICFSIIFRLYLEPLLEKPLHLTFGRSLITIVTMTPTMTLSLGFILIPLGLLMVAARQQAEQKMIPVRNRYSEK
ncbi:hypothetical protein [Roseibacillus persicicus]|uniref:Uncharacterized protein n=1 Tax=Roseibacillus persicicus TaxID=454148 RepID=A0A918WMF9_9BACT|nr:hypothetical protein [Roseibacillus persicicus]GHC56910.1 hypothetical protein GCM10007100_24660 [Roseibacillus persicicus]